MLRSVCTLGDSTPRRDWLTCNLTYLLTDLSSFREATHPLEKASNTTHFLLVFRT